ncbi:hypothetical protein Tco_0860346 [Tanacetum coccineum]|uniref:Uncharacterized protein n=1 Tax=Tanacetum coccineum TaxID=301880 RepID=A0ABQ5BIQ2_9ASTR
MAFDLRPTEDVLPWPGNANMAFDLRPTEDVLPWPGNANMAFDLRPTEDVLPWPGNANMAFDLRPTEDVLPWPGNANMAFDLRPTEDVLPWPGNANMAFDLRPTEDVLPWAGNARRYLRDMHEDNYNGIRISAALVIGTCRVDKGFAAHDVSHCEVNFQMQGGITFASTIPLAKPLCDDVSERCDKGNGRGFRRKQNQKDGPQ